MEEQELKSGTCHFTLGDNFGRILVAIAREKDTFEEGITALFQAGIENYDICEQIMKGKLTLDIEMIDEHQHFKPIPDEGYIPPEEDFEAQKMRKEVEKYCEEVMHTPYAGVPAWRLMHSQVEIGFIEMRMDLLRSLAKHNPRKAYEDMKSMRQSLIDETNERAVERHQYLTEKHERNSIFDDPENTKKIAFAATVEDAKQKIEEYKVNGKVIHAKQHLDPCNDPDCRFAQIGMCCYGSRNRKGCIAEVPELEDQEFITKKFIDVGADIEMIKAQASKQFIFTFEGHEYTYYDNARMQSRCPHCDAGSITGNFIHPICDDKAGTFKFIGIRQNSEKEYAVCFECQACYEKLYYHIDYSHIERWLEETPEMNDKIHWIAGCEK